MSNRESARDEWFRLLREAFSAASRNGSSQRSSFGSNHVLHNTGTPPLAGPEGTCQLLHARMHSDLATGASIEQDDIAACITEATAASAELIM